MSFVLLYASSSLAGLQLDAIFQLNPDLVISIFLDDHEGLMYVLYVILIIETSFYITINCVEECYFTSDLGAY